MIDVIHTAIKMIIIAMVIMITIAAVTMGNICIIFID